MAACAPVNEVAIYSQPTTLSFRRRTSGQPWAMEVSDASRSGMRSLLVDDHPRGGDRHHPSFQYLLLGRQVYVFTPSTYWTIFKPHRDPTVKTSADELVYTAPFILR
jgi:hypothetical protein